MGKNNKKGKVVTKADKSGPKKKVQKKLKGKAKAKATALKKQKQREAPQGTPAKDIVITPGMSPKQQKKAAMKVKKAAAKALKKAKLAEAQAAEAAAQAAAMEAKLADVESKVTVKIPGAAKAAKREAKRAAKRKREAAESSSESSAAGSGSGSGSSSSSSSSSSEEKKPMEEDKKADSSSSSSSSSSEEKKEEAKKSESSSSSSSSSKSDKKEEAKKSDSSSSSSSSSSDGTDSDDGEKAETSEPAAKKAKVSAPVTPAKSTGGDGNCRLFLGNCSFDIDDDAVKAAFGKFGEIVKIDWITDRDTGKFYGTGFLEFATPEAANEALSMDGTEISGRATRVQIATPRTPKAGGGGGGFGAKKTPVKNEVSAKPPGCTTVFVGGLPYTVEDAQIHEFFKPAGEISQIRYHEPNGEFKGCAFIEFNESSATDEAVKLGGQELGGRWLRIDYAKGRN